MISTQIAQFMGITFICIICFMLLAEVVGSILQLVHPHILCADTLKIIN